MPTMIPAILVLALAPIGAQDVYGPAERPLDERIKAEKITENDPPPLPQQVILPVPPEFRVAYDASRVPITREHYDKAIEAMLAGLAFLKTQQGDDGAWMRHLETTPTDVDNKPSPVSVAVTAMAIKAFTQADPGQLGPQRFRAAMQYVERARNDDGSFEGGALTNYVTSAVVMALSTIDRADFDDDITDSIAWLELNQWDQGEGLDARQDWFGGAGYGNRGRPDVSNTQSMLDAMYEAGVSPDEPAMQRALSFISRAQNLEATNTSAWTGNDGGFVYTPANGGESMASEAAGEGRFGEKIAAGASRSLRSYGSMTYAGFKSMLYAGLSPDDVRVRAAFDWIRKNWTFDANPGLGDQGLYYYYTTMARALRAAQQPTITDIDGVEHNWRQELIDAVTARRRDDGSWVNQADRWLEGEPVMATVYAVLALQEAIKPAGPVE